MAGNISPSRRARIFWRLRWRNRGNCVKNTPKIACFNKAKTPLGVDLNELIATLQIYVDKFVAPVWGTPARLVKSTGFVKGAWAMVFLDGVRSEDALGYH